MKGNKASLVAFGALMLVAGGVLAQTHGWPPYFPHGRSVVSQNVPVQVAQAAETVDESLALDNFQLYGSAVLPLLGTPVQAESTTGNTHRITLLTTGESHWCDPPELTLDTGAGTEKFIAVGEQLNNADAGSGNSHSLAEWTKWLGKFQTIVTCIVDIDTYNPSLNGLDTLSECGVGLGLGELNTNPGPYVAVVFVRSAANPSGSWHLRVSKNNTRAAGTYTDVNTGVSKGTALPGDRIMLDFNPTLEYAAVTINSQRFVISTAAMIPGPSDWVKSNGANAGAALWAKTGTSGTNPRVSMHVYGLMVRHVDIHG